MTATQIGRISDNRKTRRILTRRNGRYTHEHRLVLAVMLFGIVNSYSTTIFRFRTAVKRVPPILIPPYFKLSSPHRQDPRFAGARGSPLCVQAEGIRVRRLRDHAGVGRDCACFARATARKSQPDIRHRSAFSFACCGLVLHFENSHSLQRVRGGCRIRPPIGCV